MLCGHDVITHYPLISLLCTLSWSCSSDTKGCKPSTCETRRKDAGLMRSYCTYHCLPAYQACIAYAFPFSDKREARSTTTIAIGCGEGDPSLMLLDLFSKILYIFYLQPSCRVTKNEQLPALSPASRECLVNQTHINLQIAVGSLASVPAP